MRLNTVNNVGMTKWGTGLKKESLSLYVSEENGDADTPMPFNKRQ